MALSHEEAAHLLGAYALDAVDDDERRSVEAHAEQCPRCAAEIAEHRETASWLAHSTEAAPAGVWAAIDDEIDQRPSAAVVPLIAKRRLTRLLAVAAAAALLLGATAVVVQQQREIDGLRDQVAASGLKEEALRVLTLPDARRAVLRTGDGDALAQVVVAPDGTGFVVEDDLPPLDAARTYQLWALVDGVSISAGVLGPNPDVVPFRFAGPAQGIAISIEDVPGATSPARPLASGLLDA